jgi:hypothetical protein
MSAFLADVWDTALPILLGGLLWLLGRFARAIAGLPAAVNRLTDVLSDHESRIAKLENHPVMNGATP